MNTRTKMGLAVGMVLAILGLSTCSDDSPSDRNGNDAGNGDAATGATLSGRVVDSAGDPVDAEVSVGTLSAFTDLDGKYTLTGVPEGSVTVVIKAHWFVEQEETATVSSGSGTLDVTLTAATLTIDADDQTLANTYNKSFKWNQDKVSVVVVADRTRRAFESAVYWLNPAFYRDTSSESTVTPSAKPTIGSGGGENFDQLAIASGDLQGTEVLVANSIVDSLDGTIPTQAQTDFLMWDPMLEFLKSWDLTKTEALVIAGAAVRQQQWGGDATEPQTLQKVFLLNNEIWVQVAFEDFLEVGTGITDSDGDGRKEVYGKLSPSLYTQDVYNALANDYAKTALSDDGLKALVDDVVDALYSRSNPEVVATAGTAYEATGVGTFNNPFVVFKQADDSVNVLLLAQ